MSIYGAKPFSLQSPEAIAKQYEGNKQKIAQAIQLGLVDPTAGTLAGMFIDRMRAGAAKEQGPPRTVAQQVLGSSPAAQPPGGPPMAQQAGVPPPPMPAPQGAPAPIGGPPVQAASGGLMSIPIPDAMFDEPEGAAMARGGLVAFAGGKSVGTAAQSDEEEIPFEESFLGQAASGVYNAFRNPTPEEQAIREAKARALKAKNDKGFAQLYGGKYNSVADEEPQSLPVKATPVKAPVSPPVKPAKTLPSPRPPAPRTPTAEQGLGSREPKTPKGSATEAPTPAPKAPTTVAEDLKMVQALMQDPETKAYMDGQTDRLAKRKKEDVWTTLAQIGFGMAASKSPTLLGAIGEAGTAAVPGMEKAMQARRAAEADFAKQRMDQRGRDVTTALGYNQSQAQLGMEEKKLTQQGEQARAQIAAQLKIAEMSNSTQLQAARIAAAKMGDTDYKWSISQMAADLFASDPKTYPTLGAATTEAMKQYLSLAHPAQGTGIPLAQALGNGGMQGPAKPSGNWGPTQVR